MIAQGRKRGGLYALNTMDKTTLFSIRFRSAIDEVWHQRLGHPQYRVVELLKNNKLIVSTSKNKSICTSCQMAKACRLPFILSNEFCSEPFGVIHCDLWGPAPVTSFQRYQYYVIFVDEFTRYTWYFPLKHKSDFLQCLISFHKFIETQFDKKIYVFQSDGGGEFDNAFTNYLKTHGIKHQLSCPRKPEQNGLVERKHRNIIKLGLTMMFHASVQKRFWVEAFGTTVWLINRQPSQVLN